MLVDRLFSPAFDLGLKVPLANSDNCGVQKEGPALDEVNGVHEMQPMPLLRRKAKT